MPIARNDWASVAKGGKGPPASADFRAGRTEAPRARFGARLVAFRLSPHPAASMRPLRPACGNEDHSMRRVGLLAALFAVASVLPRSADAEPIPSGGPEPLSNRSVLPANVIFDANGRPNLDYVRAHHLNGAVDVKGIRAERDPLTGAPTIHPEQVTTNSDADWATTFGPAGADYGGSPEIDAVAVFNGDLILAGNFSQANDGVNGGKQANHLARWDGSAWQFFGSTGSSSANPGMNYPVEALAADANYLYVGGFFTTIDQTSYSGIARWNGSSWSSMGTGISPLSNGGSGVYALKLISSTLYVAGSFTQANGASRSNIASWDTGTSTWNGALGAGTNGTVYALEASGSTLYVGGSFSSAGGTSCQNISSFNGTSWSVLGTGGQGPDGTVYALLLFGSNLIVGGQFSNIKNTSGTTIVSGTTNIAQWSGTAWSALGTLSGTGSKVTALTSYSSQIVAGGTFTSPCSYLAKYNSGWGSFSSTDPNGAVTGLGTYSSGSQLIAGGQFTSINGTSLAYVGRYFSSAWHPFLNGLQWTSSSKVSGFGSFGWFSDLYVVGTFDHAGTVAVSNIARWNSGTWSALGGGLSASGDGAVRFGNDLIVVGAFTSVGSGTTAYRVAKWTPGSSVWAILGASATASGFDAEAVGALQFNGDLYAWGNFSGTDDGLQTLTGLGKWNGTTWVAVGNWTSVVASGKHVTAAAIYNGNLYAATNEPKLYKLSGSSWSSIAVPDNGIASLGVSGTKLYIGGDFQNIGPSTPSTSAKHIASYDGTTLAAVGPGIDGPAYALITYHGDLIATGNFSHPVGSGTVLSGVGRWDGSNWVSMGSSGPLSSPGYALVVQNNDLYVGGTFYRAGGKPSFLIADYYESDAVAPAAITDLGLSVSGCTTLDVTWTAVGDDGSIGSASSYDLAWDTSAISSGDFSSHNHVTIVAADPRGTAETYTLSLGLCSGDIYVAMKALDDASNASAISNLPATRHTWCSEHECDDGGSLRPIIPDITFRQITANPSTGTVAFALGLPAGADELAAEVTLYDVVGRRVATLLREQVGPGWHYMQWTAPAGAAGLYYVRAAIRGEVITRPVVVLR